jgi:hypothetical protein
MAIPSSARVSRSDPDRDVSAGNQVAEFAFPFNTEPNYSCKEQFVPDRKARPFAETINSTAVRAYAEGSI